MMVYIWAELNITEIQMTHSSPSSYHDNQCHLPDDAFEDAAEPDEKEKIGEAAGEHYEEGHHNHDHRDHDGDHEEDELRMTNEICKYYDNSKFNFVTL